jgi:hypothetical protein
MHWRTAHAQNITALLYNKNDCLQFIYRFFIVFWKFSLGKLAHSVFYATMNYAMRSLCWIPFVCALAGAAFENEPLFKVTRLEKEIKIDADRVPSEMTTPNYDGGGLVCFLKEFRDAQQYDPPMYYICFCFGLSRAACGAMVAIELPEPHELNENNQTLKYGLYDSEVPLQRTVYSRKELVLPEPGEFTQEWPITKVRSHDGNFYTECVLSSLHCSNCINAKNNGPTKCRRYFVRKLDTPYDLNPFGVEIVYGLQEVQDWIVEELDLETPTAAE